MLKLWNERTVEKIKYVQWITQIIYLNVIQINKRLEKSNSNNNKNERNETKLLMTLEYLIILMLQFIQT